MGGTTPYITNIMVPVSYSNIVSKQTLAFGIWNWKAMNINFLRPNFALVVIFFKFNGVEIPFMRSYPVIYDSALKKVFGVIQVESVERPCSLQRTVGQEIK